MGGECVGVSDGVEVSISLMNVGGKGGGKEGGIPRRECIDW